MINSGIILRINSVFTEDGRSNKRSMIGTVVELVAI